MLNLSPLEILSFKAESDPNNNNGVLSVTLFNTFLNYSSFFSALLWVSYLSFIVFIPYALDPLFTKGKSPVIYRAYGWVPAIWDLPGSAFYFSYILLCGLISTSQYSFAF